MEKSLTSITILQHPPLSWSIYLVYKICDQVSCKPNLTLNKGCGSIKLDSSNCVSWTLYDKLNEIHIITGFASIEETHD